MLRVKAAFGSIFLLIGGLALFRGSWVPPAYGDALPEIKGRLLNDIKYLASDELEGRGVGTEGINKAADFIKSEMAKAGLSVEKVGGDARQTFEIVTGSKLGEPNSLQLIGPKGEVVDLKIGSDCEVGSFGGNGVFDADVVFCGYGINTIPESGSSDTKKNDSDKKPREGNPGEKVAVKSAQTGKNDHAVSYNDFEGIDVAGKVVVFMRRNPGQSNAPSHHGSDPGFARYADLRSKMKQAAAQKAAAVLVVNDPYSATKAVNARVDNLKKSSEKLATSAEEFLTVDQADSGKLSAAREKLAEAVNQRKALIESASKADDDALMKFGYAGSGDSDLPPAFHIRAKTCNQMLAANNTDLATLESQIDSDSKPRSFVVTGWKAKGVATTEKVRSNVSNVIGVIDGEGPLADETVVVGAHYDHVGRGGQNSMVPGSNEIHNGADDNASGTVTLLELARRFGDRAKARKPARRIVFIAFTGEELGLLGSARYCKEPVFSLDKTIAMFNMDMVGRLKDDNKLIVYGTGTTSRWESDLKRFNDGSGFSLVFKPEGLGPSDHASFYAKKIPVLHFFTGEHADYHKPSDDWEKINIDGVSRVADLMEKIISETVERTDRPEYIAVKGSGGPARSGDRPYVGTIPEFGNSEPGYAISGTAPGSPADKGGLMAGDRIVKLGTHQVGNLEDYDVALRKFAAGDDVDFVVVRNNQQVTVKVKLDPPR